MKIFTNAQFKEEVSRILLESRREDELRREMTNVDKQLYDIQRRLDRLEGAYFNAGRLYEAKMEEGEE